MGAGEFVPSAHFTSANRESGSRDFIEQWILGNPPEPGRALLSLHHLVFRFTERQFPLAQGKPTVGEVALEIVIDGDRLDDAPIDHGAVGVEAAVALDLRHNVAFEKTAQLFAFRLGRLQEREVEAGVVEKCQ